MRKFLLWLLVFVTAPVFAQTTTTYVGTIRDLQQNLVTYGQVTFTLAPSVDATVAGVSRFVPTTITCQITPTGTLQSQAGGPCAVTMNTSLNPTGTSYRICIQPNFVTPGSCFFDYATTATRDISTVAPTLPTGPINYSGIPGPAGPATTVASNGANGNFAVTGQLTGQTTNGQVNVALFPGADLGAQVAAAAASFGAACPNLLIPAGSYTWSTLDVILQPCTRMDGSRAIIHVPAGIAKPPVVFARLDQDASPTSPNYHQFYTTGWIHGMHFIGGDATETSANSAVPCIWIGGDLGGPLTNGNPNYLAALMTFDDVIVSNCGAAYELGRGFQITWINGSLYANGFGFTFQDGIAGLENLNLHGTQILNNFHQGINHVQHGVYVEMGLYGVSVDYNGKDGTSPNISFTNGQLVAVGGHIEGPTLPFVTVPKPNSGVSANLTFLGTELNFTNASSTTVTPASFFEIDGLNDVLNLGPGVNVQPGPAIKSLVAWNTIGSGFNRLRISPYSDGRVAALSGSVMPEEYTYPIYSQYGLQIGTQTNVGPQTLTAVTAVTPSTTAAGGTFIGWNNDGTSGRTGFYNGPGKGTGGWDFLACTSSGSACTAKATIDSNGNLVGAGVQLGGGPLVTNTLALPQVNPGAQPAVGALTCVKTQNPVVLGVATCTVASGSTSVSCTCN